MNLDEYASGNDRELKSLFDYLLLFLLSFISPNISRRVWFLFLNGVYSRVKKSRDDFAFRGREFYDSERARNLPNSERFDFFASTNYPIEWFAEAVEPVFQYLQTDDADPDTAIEEFTARVTKIVEDGGRRTLLRAVSEDEEALGWARFDPEPPTCAFCTMLISRGPDYLSARTAGLTVGNEEARDLYDRGELSELNKLMNDWHPNCTCVVVPVFKYSAYPSEKQELEAFEIYKASRKWVIREGLKPTAKNILNRMRRVFRKPALNEDEIELPAA